MRIPGPSIRVSSAHRRARERNRGRAGGNAIFVGGEFHFINGESRDISPSSMRRRGLPRHVQHPPLRLRARPVVRGTTLTSPASSRRSTASRASGWRHSIPRRERCARTPRSRSRISERARGRVEGSTSRRRREVVAIGNFTKVGGLDRTELAVLNLSTIRRGSRTGRRRTGRSRASPRRTTPRGTSTSRPTAPTS